MKKPGFWRFSGSFFLVTAWMNYLDRQGVVPMALLACVLHEWGHYLAIRRAGGEVRYVRVTAAGAEMRLERELSYRREFLCALAGPAANLALAAFFCAFSWGRLFAGINLALALLNLAPVRGLDGGRALQCGLCLLAGEETAEWTAQRFDALCCALLLGLGGAVLRIAGNPTLLLVAVWMWLTNWRQM